VTDDDPLAGADVGETRHVEEETAIDGYRYLPRWRHGRDRDADLEVTDARVVEREAGTNDIEVTVEGEVTKWLPPRWDQCDEPRTPRERRDQQIRTWLRRVGRALGILLPFGLTVFIMHSVMSAIYPVMIEGQTIQEPSIWPIVFLIGFAAFIVWALPHLPGRINGGHI